MATNQSQYEEMCDVYERYNKGGLVPVVRCKDCVRYVPFKDVDGVCLAHNTGVLIVMSQNGYCNLGERREDNYEEPEINPCRGCEDYDGKGGCLSNGGCGSKMEEEKDE